MGKEGVQGRTGNLATTTRRIGGNRSFVKRVMRYVSALTTRNWSKPTFGKAVESRKWDDWKGRMNAEKSGVGSQLELVGEPP